MAESKISTEVQSFLTIFIVCLITPLIAGGSIALAADYAGEVIISESPTDTNGFQWNGGTQGNCITTSLSGTPSTPSPSSTVSSYADVNYTSLSYPILNGSTSGSFSCHQDASNPFILNLPSDTFINNESHSRFIYQWVSSSGCTSSCSTDIYDRGWDFTWSLNINNTTVMEYESYQKGYIEYGSNVRPFWKIDHQIKPIDYNNIQRQMAKCEDSCIFQLLFSDVQEGSISSSESDFSKAPWMVTGNHKTVSYGLSEFTADLVLTVTPYILGIIFLIVALASTPFWNPVMGSMTKMTKQGGLV